MENAQVAAVFDEIADILEIQGGDTFRIRSYRNAARTVRDLPERIADLAGDANRLRELPGIGEALAKKIQEIVATGTAGKLQELRRQIPAGLTELLAVPGLGPKKVKLLNERLGLAGMDALRKAAEAHRIRDLPGMGDKTEEKILKGLATVSAEKGRVLLKEAADQVKSLGRHLDALKSIRRWVVAGSFRRRKETIGDLDILVVASDRRKAAAGILGYAGIGEVLARGEEKVTVRLGGGLEVDFRFFGPESFGAALVYFTGSKAHNIAIRKIAQQKGWKLNEYGVFRGKQRLAGAGEEGVYAKLGLAFVPPELREDRGEVPAAARGEIPKLVELADLRGDLHDHTRETDGRDTLEDMVRAARERGLEYLAITDHSRAVTVARGMDEARLRRHAERIREYGRGLKGFWLMAGVEVDILKSGKLDLPEKLLAGLDWVTASIHSHFSLDEAAMTARLLAAIRSGVITAIAHPLTREIGKRDPIRFDVDRVFAECRESGVCLEINCYPDRLDLPDTYCQRARELGATMVIATDAHKTGDLEFLEYGVGVARRGWLAKRDVLNTLSAAQLRKRLDR